MKTVISKSTKRRQMKDGGFSKTQMVIHTFENGKNRKGKKIFISHTRHERID